MRFLTIFPRKVLNSLINTLEVTKIEISELFNNEMITKVKN